MTPEDEEFEFLLRNAGNLTPEQRNVLVHRVIARARAYRAEAIRDLFRWLVGWFRRRAAIAELRRLDERMLKDIGISRGDIETAVRGSERSPPRAATPRPGTAATRSPQHCAGRAA